MAPILYILFGLLVGAAAGGLIGWLLAARRASTTPPPDQRLEAELRQQLGLRETAIDQLRTELSSVRVERLGAEAAKSAAETALADARREYERQFELIRKEHEQALSEMRLAFTALSADALKQTQPEFLRLATETLGKFQESAKGDLAQRQQSIATLIEPLKQQLETYQRRLQQSDAGQSVALGELKQHLESLVQQHGLLSAETIQLRRVLSSSQARGKWGETTLRRVVEAAGMSAHCDFTEQMVAGESKPDLIVHLPGERTIIIDSKVPDLEFLAASDERDDRKRSEMIASHASKMRATIKALSERDYPAQFPNSLDNVILFVPTESLFSVALESDPDLLVWAASRKVLLATPASLIGLLRAITVSWQHHAQSRNAREIAEAAQELYSRIVRLSEHFQRIGEALSRAGQAFNEAVGSYDRMVRPSGERLVKLGGGTAGKELADVRIVETSLRPTVGGRQAP